MTIIRPGMRSSRRAFAPWIAAICAGTMAVSACGEGSDGEPQQSSSMPASASADEKTTPLSFAADAAGPSPLSQPFRDRKASARDLDRFEALMERRGEDAPFQVGEAIFDARLGAIVLSNVSNTQNGRVFTVGRIELYGVDFDYLDSLGTDNPLEARREVLRKARLFDVSLSGFEDLSFSGDMTLEAMEIDRLTFDTRKPDRRGDGPSGLAIGGLYIAGMEMATGAGEGREVEMSLADLRIEDLARGRFGGVFLQGFSYTTHQDREDIFAALEADGIAPALPEEDSWAASLLMPAEQRMDIDTLSWGASDVSGLLAWLERGEMPPVTERGLVSIGRMEARNAASWINGRRASHTAQSVLEPVEFHWLIPLDIHTVTRGMTLDLTAWADSGNEAVLAAMKAHGLDALEAQGDIDWHYDPQAASGAFRYTVTMPDHGDLALSWDLARIDSAMLESIAERQSPLPLAGIALDDLSLEVDDRGLIDAISAVAAAESGEDPQVLRDSLPALVGLGSGQLAAAVPAVEGYAAATGAFLREGGSLEIAMRPAEPVPFLTIALMSQVAPQSMPDLLGLTVSHQD